MALTGNLRLAAALLLLLIVVLILARWLARDFESPVRVEHGTFEAESVPAPQSATPPDETWRLTPRARRDPTAPLSGGAAAGVASDAAAAVAAAAEGYGPVPQKTVQP